MDRVWKLNTGAGEDQDEDELNPSDIKHQAARHQGCGG